MWRARCPLPSHWSDFPILKQGLDRQWAPPPGQVARENAKSLDCRKTWFTGFKKSTICWGLCSCWLPSSSCGAWFLGPSLLNLFASELSAPFPLLEALCSSSLCTLLGGDSPAQWRSLLVLFVFSVRGPWGPPVRSSSSLLTRILCFHEATSLFCPDLLPTLWARLGCRS